MAKNKGPLWKELDGLGLNEPKSEKEWESVERRTKKFRIARDSDAPDAREREDSAHTALMITARDASQDRKSGGDNSSKEYAQHKKWAKDYAEKEWKSDSDLRPGEMAQHIHARFLKGNADKLPLKPLPVLSTITGWITPLAPSHLKGKPGRRSNK